MFLGCPGQLDGCLCEYIVMPEFCCFEVNEVLNQTEAVLVEPLSIGVYSVEMANTNFQDKSIGIFGAGPIGLSVLMVLKSMGEYQIFNYEPLEYRRSKAFELGATYAINPFESDAFETTSQIEPLLLDVVFDCSGQQKAIDDATRIVNPGGKLILTGIPPEARYTFDMDMMRRKEITIINVRRQNYCVEKSIKLIENGLPVEKMVTHHFRPEETLEAFEIVAEYKDGVIKALIDFF
jgi:L-iditol 2-dehydrogenase